MCMQIVQTRVISVVLYYHLAFFAVSMAMLGMTAGSLLVYFKPWLFTRERLFEHLAWISAAFAISIVLSTLSLITTVVDTGISNTLVRCPTDALVLSGQRRRRRAGGGRCRGDQHRVFDQYEPVDRRGLLFGARSRVHRARVSVTAIDHSRGGAEIGAKRGLSSRLIGPSTSKNLLRQE